MGRENTGFPSPISDPQHNFGHNITAVTVAAGIRFFVFLPNQFQGQVLVALQFLVDGGEIRWLMPAPARRGSPLAEQEFVKFLLTEIFRQRPTELGCLGQFQVLVNGALNDGATADDLCCAKPNADSRRTSRILRMDNASSGKVILLCFKQNQIALFNVQRCTAFVPTRPRLVVPTFNAITRSELERFFDRH